MTDALLGFLGIGKQAWFEVAMWQNGLYECVSAHPGLARIVCTSKFRPFSFKFPTSNHGSLPIPSNFIPHLYNRCSGNWSFCWDWTLLTCRQQYPYKILLRKLVNYWPQTEIKYRSKSLNLFWKRQSKFTFKLTLISK